MDNTEIAYVDHTANGWIGCTKNSPGCKHCFAEEMDKRRLWEDASHFGAGRARFRFNWANVRQRARRWNLLAERTGRRPRVFAQDLGDLFDPEIPMAWRAAWFELFRETPNIDWVVVTKRVEHIVGMLPADWGDGYPNVWLLLTVCTQDEADEKLPAFVEIAAVLRGVSAEPLLTPLDLRPWLDCLRWVIVGGEATQRGVPRGVHPDWVRQLAIHCGTTGTAFFFKQWGSAAPASQVAGTTPVQWAVTLDGRRSEFNKEAMVAVASDVTRWEGLRRMAKGRAGHQLDGEVIQEVPQVFGA